MNDKERAQYWKSKFFKLKKSHDIINIFNIRMEEFNDVDTSQYKINSESTNDQVAHHLNLVERLDKLNKSNKGLFKTLSKKVRSYVITQRYNAKYCKRKAVMLWIKIGLILFSSANLLQGIFNKIVNGEFSMDLFSLLIQVLLSMF